MTLANVLGDATTFPDPQGIRRAGDWFRLQVDTADATAQAAVQRAWAVADAAIQAKVDAYLAKVAAAQAAGTPITENWLYQVGRLDQLRAFVAQQYLQVGLAVNRSTISAQGQAISSGVEATQRLLGAMFDGTPVDNRLDFAHLDAGSFSALVGTLQSGSPLRDLTFSNLTVAGAESVARALVAGFAAGEPIRQVAKRVDLERNMTHARAMTITRTETLRALREGSLKVMSRNPHLLEGWRWSATLDHHTCGVCIAMQGSLHGTLDPFDTHPNCRCSPMPQTKSWADLGYPGIPDTAPDLPSADDWLGKVGLDRLVRAYGPTVGPMINGGYLKAADLVHLADRGRWGKQPTLRQVGALKATAQSRGWTPPTAGKRAPKPPPAEVSGLPPLWGTGHRLDAALQSALEEHQGLAAEYRAARQAESDVRGAWYREHGPMSSGLYGSPEYQAAQARTQDVSNRWKATMDALRSRLSSERRELDDALATSRGRIPPEQARRLLADLKVSEAWLHTWVRRGTTGDMLADTYWTNALSRATSAYPLWRRLAGSGLPLRERLATEAPVRDQLRMPGGKSAWGGGKLLEQANTYWREMVGMGSWMEGEFGVTNAWSGRLAMGGARGGAGMYNWSDGIHLAADVWGAYKPVDRLKVALHELFHGLSHGTKPYDPATYTSLKGWEEGVVERCSQVWNQEGVLASGLSPAAYADGYLTYKRYTAALEGIRGVIGQPERQFYRRMILTPLPDRPALVNGWLKDAGAFDRPEVRGWLYDLLRPKGD